MKYLKIETTHVWNKKYLKQYIIGMIGFGLFIPLVVFIGKYAHVHASVKIIMALSPVIPFAMAMNAFIKNLRIMDELWRTIHINALIVTAIFTLIITVSIGMMQIINTAPTFSIFYLFPVMLLIWSISFAYFHVKYNGE